MGVRDPVAEPAPFSRRDPVAPLERAGLVPTEVRVYRADWTPAAHAQLLCVDSAERVVYVAADELGRARVTLGSAVLAECRARTPQGDWMPISPCRVYPSDGGDGWRLVCTLVPMASGGGS
jgi:hypothetical protein